MTTAARGVNPVLTVAVETFRTHQKKLLQADRAEAEMLEAVKRLAVDGSVDDRAAYVDQTNDILEMYRNSRGAMGL